MNKSILFNIKLIVLIPSIGMFIYQLSTAIGNLIEMPNVDSSYQRDLSEKDLPLITVCPTSQTNYTKLYELGYIYKAQLQAGLSNCSTGFECEFISWGHHLNITQEELYGQIYNAQLAKDVLFNIPNLESKLVFIPRFGYCKEILMLHPQTLIIYNKHVFTDLRIFFSDKNYRSHFSLAFRTHWGDKVIVPFGKTFYTDVEITKTSTCKIMEEDPQLFNYGQCVDNNLKISMGKLYGCVPPWMSKTNQCNTILEFKKEQHLKFFLDYAIKIEQMKNIPEELECRTCESTYYHVRVDDELDPDGDWGMYGNKTIRAIIFFDTRVKITERVHSYDAFKFIIDVGSSLGLWLGLSVLSIYDLFALAVDFIKNNKVWEKFNSVTSK